MQIIELPNPALEQKCKAVEKVTPELVNTAKEMYYLMKAANGVGLAANQCGLDMRLIVLDNKGEMLAMFNPKVLQESKDKQVDMEGCISYPNVSKKISRANEVAVKYRDINNKLCFLKVQGLLARAILHEIGHLNGELWINLEEKA